MLGRTISHYTITEKIGEGGMGVVYRAQDVKLKRDVAVKFLPKRLSVHGEERERFFHEAQAASTLNHPNICTIHEIDEVDDETFIVMELIEGTTLREWIHERIAAAENFRKLPVKEVVGIAIQIGEGLGKAHEKGIVHRDIKSENVMVTPDGRVKIMDFGLAKLQGVSKLTRAGSTVGTMAYLSPEQVEGADTDHRGDIFSFGVLMYEMLTGRFPFQAAHEAAIMYEIMHSAPVALSSSRSGIEPELERLISKCLEKNREDRFQSVTELVVDLKRFRRDTDGKSSHGGSGSGHAIPGGAGAGARVDVGPAGGPAGSRSGKSAWRPVSAAVIILLFGFIGYLLLRSTGNIDGGAKIVTKITSAPGLEMEPAMSPDGKFIAYTTDDRGNLDIVIQPVAGGQPVRVVDSDADDADPAFSPDGSQIAFVSARNRGGHLTIALGLGILQFYMTGKYGDLFIVPVGGGEPRKLADNGYNPAWSPDGKSIVFRSSARGAWDLWKVSVETGELAQITRDDDFNYQPAYSPDGRWLVYGSGDNPAYNVTVIPAAGGSPRALTSGLQLVVRPVWSEDGGHIIYSSDRGGSLNLWKIAFSPDDPGEPTPVQITVGGGADVEASPARTGRILAYGTASVNSDIWELSYPDGAPRRITSETSNEDDPSVYPDGRSLLMISNRSGIPGLYRTDLDGNILGQVTRSWDNVTNGMISPDGKKLAFALDYGSNNLIRIRDLGTGDEEEILKHGEGVEYPIWSPDGGSIAYSMFTNQKPDVWIYNLASKTHRQLTRMDFSSSFATWSPDGKFITFHMQQGAVRTIWIIPSAGGNPRQVTLGTAEHSHPQWSPVDPDVILFVLDHKNLCTVNVSTGEVTRLTAYTQADLILDYPSWAPDGKNIYYSLTRKTGDIYTLENY